MASTIKIKNSSTASAVPTSSDLVQGELAVNVTDKRIFTENSGGTVVELGTNPSSITLPDGSASAPTLTNDGDTNTGLFFPAADTVGITTGGTERARIDSAGNLGLGVTPSAWGSGRGVLQLKNNTSLTDSSGAGIWGYNWYNDGSANKYIASDYASRLIQSGGGFQWAIAASGTAGNAISFTQAMTLDASGNLGIGTSSPSTRLHLAGVADPTLRLTSSSGPYSYFESNTAGSVGIAADEGNTGSSSNINFRVDGSERARIDSSGRLLVGTTGGSDGSIFKTGVLETSLNAYRATSTAASGIFGAFSDVGGTQAVRAYFKADGGLANYSANNTNLSDENLKKDIAPAGNYLAKICAIPVKNFRYKDQSESEDITLGVIAQDVLAVAPELVSQEGFGTSEDNQQSYLSVYQTDIQYALMKCIQEQQAIITQLQADVAALKA